MNKNINFCNQTIINFYTNRRIEEEKLGDAICFSENNKIEDLHNSKAKFVLLGLPEDIGIRANFGIKGSAEAWGCFLHNFFNTQNNKFINAKNIFVLGNINFSEQTTKAEKLNTKKKEDLNKLRTLTGNIDNIVFSIISYIISCKKIPIVIGGGHNNSYGCIKGYWLVKNKTINIINLDPHADFRALEGRHSGNGFSYAMNENMIHKYTVIGLHQNYNSWQMIKNMDQNENIEYYTFEEIFIQKKICFTKLIPKIVNKLNNKSIGIEIDLDSIAYMPTSAYTPSGINVEKAREFIYLLKGIKNIAYLHIAEGAPNLYKNISKTNIGKTITYLVTDFIKLNN